MNESFFVDASASSYHAPLCMHGLHTTAVTLLQSLDDLTCCLLEWLAGQPLLWSLADWHNQPEFDQPACCQQLVQQQHS
jgi:hypothetical protein